MKAVRVTYTTKLDFAEQNSKNIQKVMNDLQALKADGIFYHATLGADGKTFTHTAFFKSDADEKTLFAVESFKYFQEQLKASQPETPPKQEIITLAGSSKKLFND